MIYLSFICLYSNPLLPDLLQETLKEPLLNGTMHENVGPALTQGADFDYFGFASKGGGLW